MPQSLSKVYIHLVYSTKNRERCLFEPLREEVFSYMAGILNNMGCDTLLVGGEIDHIHALFCQSRTMALSNIVMELKNTESSLKTIIFNTMNDMCGIESISPDGASLYSPGQRPRTIGTVALLHPDRVQ